MLTICVSCRGRRQYIPHLPPLIYLVPFHKILLLSFAFTHTFKTSFPLSLFLSVLVPFSLSTVKLKKILTWIKWKRTLTVRGVEWRELRSPWSTASCLQHQLGVKGQNTGNTFRDTRIFTHTHTQVCFYVSFIIFSLSCIHLFISLFWNKYLSSQ